MNGRTAYWLKSETDQVKRDMVYVSEHGVVIETTSGEIIEVKNGNRIATAKLIRQKPVSVPAIRYKVTGWDMKMNSIRKTVDSMEEALDLGCSMLHAKISKAKERRNNGSKQHKVSRTDI